MDNAEVMDFKAGVMFWFFLHLFNHGRCIDNVFFHEDALVEDGALEREKRGKAPRAFFGFAQGPQQQGSFFMLRATALALQMQASIPIFVQLAVEHPTTRLACCTDVGQTLGKGGGV